MDAQRFFDIAVPELAKTKASLFGTLTGTLAFIVRGVGAWTVHLGDSAHPVEHEALKNADLVLSFDAPVFEEFLAGTLDLAQALEGNHIAHDGDLSVLLSFSRLLQQPSSM